MNLCVCVHSALLHPKGYTEVWTTAHLPCTTAVPEVVLLMEENLTNENRDNLEV